MTDGIHISREDLALYAMQALSREESAPIQAHIDQCAECREELALAAGDLAMVAMAVDEQPLPAGARDRFASRIAATASPAAEPRATSRILRIPQRKRSGMELWFSWGALAALLVLAIGMSIEVADLRRQIHDEAAQLSAQKAQSALAQKVLDTLTAPAAQHIVLTAAHAHPEPTARAVYLASRGSLILQASNLAPVPQDKTYELWIIPANGKAPVPAGLFRPDATGNASLVLPVLPAGVQAKAFGVTVEKASGSDTPTLPIVLSGAAPAPGE